LPAYIHIPSAYRINAARLNSGFSTFETDEPDSYHVLFQIEEFHTGDPVLQEIVTSIKQLPSEMIKAALVHGSVATGEIIPYSDLDVLLIIDENHLISSGNRATLGTGINKIYRKILEFDPLQHHGLLCLPSAALKDWPCNFFPPALFKHSKSLNGPVKDLKINFSERLWYSKQIFRNFANRLLVSSVRDLSNISAFELKSLLSEFMLLPSLWIQCRTGKGIFKKFSFDLTRKEMSSKNWMAMELASELRLSWPDYRAVSEKIDGYYFSPKTRKLQKRGVFEIPGEWKNSKLNRLPGLMRELTCEMLEKL
jgi:hypothetical protein